MKQKLNDSILKILRNFPWPSKNSFRNFPTLKTDEKETKVVVLCTGKTYREGLWSLYSFNYFLRDVCSPLLLVDGEVTEIMRNEFNRLFSFGEIISIARIIELPSIPKKIKEFALTNWTGKKLLALSYLQQDNSIVYADNDVLLFNDPVDLKQRIINKSVPSYMYDHSEYGADAWFIQKSKKLEISISKHFNAGFMWIPKNSINLEFLRSVLEDWKPEYNTHHAEQTLFSLLLSAAHANFFDPHQYILSWSGYWIWRKDAVDLNSIAGRHYTGPTRHRMYMAAYPHLRKIFATVS